MKASRLPRLGACVTLALCAGSVARGQEPGPGKAAGDSERIRELIERLGSTDPGVRRHAAEALGRIGPAAVPALIRALKDRHHLVRSSAAHALGGLGPATLPALIRALKDKDKGVRQHAAQALKKSQGKE